LARLEGVVGPVRVWTCLLCLVLSHGDQTGVAEHSQVLGYRADCHVEAGGEVAGADLVCQHRRSNSRRRGSR
jgi:hypothetical protein